MSIFTDRELGFLREDRKLARIATVGPDGMPHVVPSGWSFDDEAGVFRLGGIRLEASKKFRDVQRTGRAALVIDDVLPPWQPRGIEVRGDAEAIAGQEAAIVIHPRRIISWGIESQRLGDREARTVASAEPDGASRAAEAQR